MKNILIIGPLPPPIGGVSIHTFRLLRALKNNNIQHFFYRLNIRNLIWLLFVAYKYSCIHIHTSNPFVRFYVMCISKLYRIYGIVTIHGDLNLFKSKFKNFFDKQALRISYKPIVLNSESLMKALNINKKTEIVSSFIPPDLENEKIGQNHADFIWKMKKKYKMIICTNAYGFSKDKNDEEIYGILELIEAFRILNKFGMIISDPSQEYSDYFKSNAYIIPKNIYIISEEHSYYKVLELSDVSVRNTLTDGDSLSVKESLYLNKWTFVTDCVSRPQGSIIYKRGNFLAAFADFINSEKCKLNYSIENGFFRLNEIYRDCKE